MIGLIIGALLLILLIYGVFIEPHVMKVRHVKIAQKQNIKIAHFTDTHFAWHTSSRRFIKFARNIADEKPDLIIFSGDLFDKVAWAKDKNWSELLVILSGLNAPLGKFAILGNHDFDDEKSSDFVEGFLEKAGFTLLKNRSVLVDNAQRTLSVSGVDDWREGQPDLELYPLEASFSLLALHEPDTVLDMETINQFDLILSGHSHGGQIRIGNWRLHNKGSSSADGGLYQLNERTKLYVNRGIGLTFLPIRFGVPPEIVYYEI
ncbi:MAG: metallophosphoesterase [Lactococcus cremoris]